MLKKKIHLLVISGLFSLLMVTESFAGIVVTQFEILSPPTNSLFSDVFGVNSTGQVVGRSYASDFSERATLWNNGVATYLATPGGTGTRANWINNSGKVVGSSTFANGEQRATLWHNGNATDLGPAGESSSEAKGINGSGQVVGYGSADINARARAILWSADGVPSDLGNPLGAVASQANAINDAGQVVGIAFDRDFQQRGKRC